MTLLKLNTPYPSYWIVKIYDPETGTTTTIGKEAYTREELKAEIAEEGLWVYVDAVYDPEMYPGE